MQDNRSPRFYIVPEYQSSASINYQVIDPATFQQIAIRTQVTQNEVDEVLMRVYKTQQQWSKVDAKNRALLAHQLANRLEAMDMKQCAIMMSREMGKPYAEAIGELHHRFANMLKWPVMKRVKLQVRHKWDLFNIPALSRWGYLYISCHLTFLSC